MRPDPGFQGFSLCSSTAIVLPPLSSLLLTRGKLGREGSGETSPDPRMPPRLVPRTVCHLLVVVVTLDENGWRASTLGTEQGPAARGVRRAAMSGITGMSHQTMPPSAVTFRPLARYCALRR
jgi:hypothetical protein